MRITSVTVDIRDYVMTLFKFDFSFASHFSSRTVRKKM